MNYATEIFYILGGAASLAFIASNYVLTRPMILIFQTLGSLFVSAQFGVFGIWSVATVNSIFIIRNIWVYVRESNATKSGSPLAAMERISTGFFFLSLLIVVYLLTNNSVFSDSVEGSDLLLWALPLLAGILNILAIAQGKVINLKIFILCSVSLWSLFDVLTGAWTTLVGDLFGAVACLVAIYRIQKKDIGKV